MEYKVWILLKNCQIWLIFWKKICQFEILSYLYLFQYFQQNVTQIRVTYSGVRVILAIKIPKKVENYPYPLEFYKIR